MAIVSERSCVASNNKALFIAEYNTAGTHDVTEGVGGGNYRVAFFDIESDGLLTLSNNSISGSAIIMTEVSIPGGTWDQHLGKRLTVINLVAYLSLAFAGCRFNQFLNGSNGDNQRKTTLHFLLIRSGLPGPDV